MRGFLWCAVAVVILSSVIGGGIWSAFDREKRAAIAYAAELADSAKVKAAEADSLRGVVQQLRDSADVRGRQNRQRLAVIRVAEVPDTCAPYVAPRDTLLDSMQEETRLLRTALNEQEGAVRRWRSAYELSALARDSLAFVLSRRPPSWTKPRVTIGPFVGWCTDGPCAGVGVSVGVSIL